MLLSFEFSNFKSFSDKAYFDMVASSVSGLDYSLVRKRDGRKTIRILPTSLVYGPNSSGKSNIVSALNVLKAVILRGHIRNFFSNSIDRAVDNIELCPNKDQLESIPVSFSITFIENERKYNYILEFIVGIYANLENRRKIIKEELFVNNIKIFHRDSTVTFYSDNFNTKIKKLLLPKHKETYIGEVIDDSLNDEELFLTGAFKNFYSKTIYTDFLNWFNNKLNVIYSANKQESLPIVEDNKSVVDMMANKLLGFIGSSSKAIVYSKEPGQPYPVRQSLVARKHGKDVLVPASIFESYGSLRMLNIFPILFKAINIGGVLIIDELDASIHPMIIMNIINIFHNNEINTKGAQLIFNTHNPIFLNGDLVRRDEIKFVEKENNVSSLYSLSDFKTSGVNSVRKHEDYIKNYFINKYGAIKFVDLTSLFNESEV